MQFKGQLLLPGESGAGLRVNLDVAEHHLAVESDGGGLGAWPLEVVDVERNGADFDLTVAGEPLRFVADDTIAFAYTGVPVIEGVASRSRGRSGLRSVLDRFRSGAATSSTETVAVEEAPEQVSGSRQTVEDVARPTEENTFTLTTVAPQELGRTAPEQVIADPQPEPAAATEKASSETETCPGIRGDGRPCESQILTSSGYCYPHDPRRAFEDGYQLAQEARSQIKRDATGRLNRIYDRLDRAIRQVERGDLDPHTAMAIAQLARTMCAIVEMDDSPETAAL